MDRYYRWFGTMPILHSGDYYQVEASSFVKAWDLIAIMYLVSRRRVCLARERRGIASKFIG
jgi:hypothetical protein